MIYESINYSKDIFISSLIHKIEGFESVLQKAFLETATDETLILSNFLNYKGLCCINSHGNDIFCKIDV